MEKEGAGRGQIKSVDVEQDGVGEEGGDGEVEQEVMVMVKFPGPASEEPVLKSKLKVVFILRRRKGSMCGSPIVKSILRCNKTLHGDGTDP